MVAVVGALEAVLAGIGDGAELPAAIRPDDDVRDRVRADRGGKRAARARAADQHLQPAQLDRLLGAERAQQVVRPGAGGQHDLAGRRRSPPTSRAPTARPASTRIGVHLAAEVVPQPAAAAAANQPRHIFCASAKPPSGS